MSATKETTIRILEFSGKEEDWTMWSLMFMAKATKCKYIDVLLGDLTPPVSTRILDVMKADEKALQDA